MRLAREYFGEAIVVDGGGFDYEGRTFLIVKKDFLFIKYVCFCWRCNSEVVLLVLQDKSRQTEE